MKKSDRPATVGKPVKESPVYTWLTRQDRDWTDIEFRRLVSSIADCMLFEFPPQSRCNIVLFAEISKEEVAAVLGNEDYEYALRDHGFTPAMQSVLPLRKEEKR